MNAWNDSDDPFEWDGNTWGDSEKELEDSISGMTARFLLLNNVQDYQRYTTPAEMVTAIVKLNCTGKMLPYWQEIKSLWDEYFKFKVQIKQNEINPEMDDFTREMEISFGCSDMMKKTEKVWAELLVCDKPEGKEISEKAPDYEKSIGQKVLQAEQEIASKTVLKADYPQFEKELSVLLENNIVRETETGYSWLKSKNALAFYFKDLKPTRKREWAIIERAFSVEGLRNDSRTAYKKKPRDYEKILSLVHREV